MLNSQRLIAEQYQNASNLDARIALHTRFSTAETNWHHWLFDHYALPQDARVLELGCGSAKLWAENAGRIPKDWEVTLTDLSSGMLDEARARLEAVPRPFRFAVADAQEVPFEDSSFDAVIANHMLGHVSDQKRALTEIRRVLRPGGNLYATTNGRAHMREMGELAWQLVDEDVLEQVRAAPAGNSFRLENGAALLEPYFGEVALHRFESSLEVTEAEPLIAYITSMHTSHAFRQLPEAAMAQKVTDFKAYLDERIAAHGALRITQAPGLFDAC